MVRRNLVKEGPSNSQPARLPAITIPPTTDPALRQTLEAIKERLEVREGARGNPYEKVVTLRDLETQGITQGGVAVFGRSGAFTAAPDTGIDFKEVKREVAELRTKVLNLPLTKTLSSPIDTSRVDSEISRLNARVEAIRAGFGLEIGTTVGQISATVAQEALARRKAVAREAVIRADQISIEAHQRLIGVQAAAEAALAAAIAADNERTDRIADVAIARTELTTDIQEGLSAEAAERTLLAAQLRGGYTGTDPNQVTTGLLYEERVARANQDNALALQITLLSAGVGEQFDWAQIWYFDAGVEGWSGNGTPTVTDGWLRPANQGSGAYVTSPTGLNLDAAKYRQVRLRLRKVGTPTFAGFLWWNGIAQSWDVSRRLTITEPSFDANGIGVVTINTEWTGTIDQLRLDLSSAQTVTDYFEVDWFAVGRPSPGASTAQLLEEQQARAAADSAEVAARETLATTILGQADPAGLNLGNLTQGLIYDERVARSTAVGAVASDLTLLEGSVTTLDGEVQTLSGTVTSLSEVVADVESVSVQNSLELIAVRKDVDIDAEALLRNVLANENTRDFAVEEVAIAKQALTADIQAGLSAEAAQRLLLSAIVDQNSADIVSEQIARADGDSALASDISALTATVGVNTASIITEQQARADADSALSSSISALTTRVGDAEADIITEQQARVDGDGALASDITALTTRVGTAEADILTEQSARISGDSANATSITTLSTRLDNAGGTGVTVEQQFTAQSSINSGLLGQYSVKIDVNGKVAGFGLSNTSPTAGVGTSAFVVVADKFAVVTGGGDKVPFVIDGSQIALSGDVKIDGSLVVAGSLGVEKLAAGSIVTDSYIQSTGYTAGTSGWRIDGNGNAEFSNVTVRGTLAAGTVNTGVLVSGTTMGDIRTGALNGTSALSSLGSKLNNSAADILSGVISVTTDGGFVAGDLTWNASGVRQTGKGVAMTPQGILGHNGTKVTFSINATSGDAVFGGNLDAASGTFAGNISTSGYVLASGNITDSSTQAAFIGKNTNHSGWAGAALTTSVTGTGGLYASATGDSGQIGVWGNAGASGAGLYGTAGLNGTGVQGNSILGTGVGVQGTGNGTNGAGIECVGRFKWGGLAAPVPPNNQTTFLRGDMQWGAPTVSWANVTGKPATFPANHLISKQGQNGGENGHGFYAYWTGATLEFWVDATRICRLTPSIPDFQWN
jgi:hypothetical protein